MRRQPAHYRPAGSLIPDSTPAKAGPSSLARVNRGASLLSRHAHSFHKLPNDMGLDLHNLGVGPFWIGLQRVDAIGNLAERFVCGQCSGKAALGCCREFGLIHERGGCRVTAGRPQKGGLDGVLGRAARMLQSQCLPTDKHPDYPHLVRQAGNWRCRLDRIRWALFLVQNTHLEPVENRDPVQVHRGSKL